MGPVNPPVRPGVVYVTHTHRGRANVSQTQLFGGRCYLFSVACPSSSITHTFFYLLGNAHTHTHEFCNTMTLTGLIFWMWMDGKDAWEGDRG